MQEEQIFLRNLLPVRKSEKIEREGSRMEAAKHDKSLFKGLLIGSLVGAVAGMVFAPKSGKKLRSDIKGESEKALRETKQLYSDVRTKAGAAIGSAKGVFGGRERSDVIVFRDLEEPEEFMAEA